MIARWFLALLGYSDRDGSGGPGRRPSVGCPANSTAPGPVASSDLYDFSAAVERVLAAS